MSDLVRDALRQQLTSAHRIMILKQAGASRDQLGTPR